MQNILIILIFLIPTYFFCQTIDKSEDSFEISKLDEPKDTIKELKFQKYFFVSFGSGLGKVYLDPKTYTIINFENEISFRFSQYFSSSIGLQYGKEKFDIVSIRKGNINVLVHPIKINKFEMKIGGGLSMVKYYELILHNWYDLSGHLNNNGYTIERNSSFGINYLIECSYLIKKKFSLGAKLNFQQYQNGLASSEIMINLGFKL
jgi:hypothetical protein